MLSFLLLYSEFVVNHIEQSFWGIMKVIGQVIALYYSCSNIVIYLKLSDVYNSIIIDVYILLCWILVVGCIYLRAFNAMIMSITKD